MRSGVFQADKIKLHKVIRSPVDHVIACLAENGNVGSKPVFESAANEAKASAHGARLMVVPVLLGEKSVFCGTTPFNTTSLLLFDPLIATAAAGVHTISHLVIAGLVAWIVYDLVGLTVLRRAWINLDLIWCFSLLATATVLIFAPHA